jgi:hypothetical protein
MSFNPCGMLTMNTVAGLTIQNPAQYLSPHSVTMNTVTAHGNGRLLRLTPTPSRHIAQAGERARRYVQRPE